MKIIYPTVLLFMLLGCGGESFRASLDAEDQFIVAKAHFNKRKYDKAKEGFQRLLFEYPGSDYIDDAQFYLAECYFEKRNYQEAQSEYKFMVDNFRDSPYADDAHYKLVLCYYKLTKPYYLDQELTNQTMEEIELFLSKYPGTELRKEVMEIRNKCRNKLARKELENGKMYMKMEKYEPARIYLNGVLEEYGDTEIKDEAILLLGKCYEEEHKFDEAKEAYERVLNESEDEKSKEEARERIRKLTTRK